MFRLGVLPTANFLFKHALIQDVAYNTLLRARRRQLHAAIARTLVDQFPEQRENEPELVANHFTEAGEVDQAVSYWLKAGRRSAERSADREAVRQLQNGLNLLATLPESDERDRLEVTFQLTLGTPLMSVYSYTAPQVAAVYQRAGVLCQRLGDTEGLIMTLHALRAHQMVRGETRASTRLAEQCLLVTESYVGRDYRLLSYYGLGTSRMQLGELPQARLALEKGVALYDPERDHLLAARCIFDPRAAALALMSPVMWALGYPEQARRTGEGALGFALERAHAHTSGLTRYFAGALLAELFNDVPGAGEHARAVIALADQHNMPAWHANGTIILGWATARRGSLMDGISLIQQGLAELDAIGTVWHRPHHLGILAELHAQRGDYSAGLKLIGEAHRHVQLTDAYFWHSDICRIEGELRHQAGASDVDVEVCFAAAIEVARQQMAKSFELRAAMRMAGLWRDQGRLGDARDLLLPLYEWFTEGLDTSDLRDAKMLLDELH